MLLECRRVHFSEKFQMLQKKKMFANAAEPRDIAVLSMSWVSFPFDYYAFHVKLNILGRIVIPD